MIPCIDAFWKHFVLVSHENENMELAGDEISSRKLETCKLTFEA